MAMMLGHVKFVNVCYFIATRGNPKMGAKYDNLQRSFNLPGPVAGSYIVYTTFYTYTTCIVLRSTLGMRNEPVLCIASGNVFYQRLTTNLLKICRGKVHQSKYFMIISFTRSFYNYMKNNNSHCPFITLLQTDQYITHWFSYAQKGSSFVIHHVHLHKQRC